jgi:hypothetical protein
VPVQEGLQLLRRRRPDKRHATGPQAAWWLAAALLAGNAVGIFDAATLATTLAALRLGGVPVEASLALPGGVPALLAAADTPTADFVATDGGPTLARALTAHLGATPDGARSLRPLLAPFDGPQPGEPGFLHRFAWPRVIAIRTLRHGADLALESPRK